MGAEHDVYKKFSRRQYVKGGVAKQEAAWAMKDVHEAKDAVQGRGEDANSVVRRHNRSDRGYGMVAEHGVYKNLWSD